MVRSSVCWRYDGATISSLPNAPIASDNATYDEWLQASEALVAEVLATGLVAVKVHINPDEFAVWCARRYLDMDAEARAAFTVDAIVRGIEHHR